MAQKNMSFEDKIQRLEQIVRQLEQGEVSLEDSLKLFQEGTKLSAECNKILENAELQVEKVMKGSDGKPVMEAFSYDAQ